MKSRLFGLNVAFFAAALAACTVIESPPAQPGTPDETPDPGDTEPQIPDPAGCEPIPTECTEFVPLDRDTLEGGTTLAARTCYRVENSLSLSDGTLRIEQGAVVQFATGTGLSLGNGGQLRSEGTCEAPVLLTAGDAASSWQGVRLLDSQGVDNHLEHTVIEHAGGKNWTGAEHSGAALALEGTSSARLDHVTIRHSVTHGLLATREVDFRSEHGVFEHNNYPAYLHPEVVSRLSDDSVVRNNTHDVIRVAFVNTDKVASAQRWPALPLRIEKPVTIAAPLTLAPGASLSFTQDTSLTIESGGTLTAKGTAERPIEFVGANDVRGFWRGIEVQSGGVGTPASVGASFEHTVVAHAGSSQWSGRAGSKAALYLDRQSGVSLSNVSFRDNDGYALWANADARLLHFENGQFTHNEKLMLLHPDRVGELGSGHRFEDNDDQTIQLVFGNTNKVTKDASWADLGVPYAAQDTFEVEAALRLEAGVQVSFPQNGQLWVAPEGSLSAEGTESAPVRLVGQNEVSTGYWRGLRIQSNSPVNRLQHTEIAHAGASRWTGAANSDAAIYLDENASIALEHVAIGPGGGHGVFLDSDSTLSCQSVDFGDLVKGPVWQQLPSPGALLPGCP